MDLQLERCPDCGSEEQHNLVARRAGALMAFVRCARCGALVAHYVLQSCYRRGAGHDSWLRPGAETESGRQYLERFSRARQEALEGFAEVLAELASREGS